MEEKYINVDLVLEKLDSYREEIKEYNYDVEKLTQNELKEFRFLLMIEEIINKEGK